MKTAMPPRGSTSQDESKRHFCDRDDLRTSFSLAMSAMYKMEVPLYGDLVRIVRQTNDIAAQRTDLMITERLDLERHGAIRLGTPVELRTVRRIFALIGLSPVGYYDLSQAGLPMHATAFRPPHSKALAKNPFRVFTTLLRPELLSPSARDLALSQLHRRKIFSDKLMTLIEVGEQQGGFFPEQAEQFIIEAMQTFRWQPIAATTIEDYQQLQAEHPILADIACFNTAHINHLTPRTLDIDASERQMKTEGLSVKPRIEGPPARQNPILLRQTSFLAISEPIKFHTKQSSIELVNAYHRARFGEIEQRGAAVTPEGRQLYDQIMERVMRRMSGDIQRNATTVTTAAPSEAADYLQTLQDEFAVFPDDKASLIQQGLIYCEFRVAKNQTAHHASNPSRAHPPTSTAPAPAPSSTTPPTNLTPELTDLLARGTIDAFPLTYEDFLPLSAAGIFASNLPNLSVLPDLQHQGPDSEQQEGSVGTRAGTATSTRMSKTPNPNTNTSTSTSPGTRDGRYAKVSENENQFGFEPFSDRDGFEHSLGCKVGDAEELYAAAQCESLRECERALGLEVGVLGG